MLPSCFRRLSLGLVLSLWLVPLVRAAHTAGEIDRKSVTIATAEGEKFEAELGTLFAAIKGELTGAIQRADGLAAKDLKGEKKSGLIFVSRPWSAKPYNWARENKPGGVGKSTRNSPSTIQHLSPTSSDGSKARP